MSLPRQVLVTDLQSPLVGVQVVYPKTISRGDAWDDLWANPPVLVLGDQTFTPLFERIENRQGKDFRRNPYRKGHTDTSWVWTVSSWVRGKPRRRRPAPQHMKRSRYELLLDDEWLGSGVEDPG